jgi:hypothetical protein
MHNIHQELAAIAGLSAAQCSRRRMRLNGDFILATTMNEANDDILDHFLVPARIAKNRFSYASVSSPCNCRGAVSFKNQDAFGFSARPDWPPSNA